MAKLSEEEVGLPTLACSCKNGSVSARLVFDTMLDASHYAESRLKPTFFIGSMSGKTQRNFPFWNVFVASLRSLWSLKLKFQNSTFVAQW